MTEASGQDDVAEVDEADSNMTVGLIVAAVALGLIFVAVLSILCAIRIYRKKRAKIIDMSEPRPLDDDKVIDTERALNMEAQLPGMQQ